MSGAAVPIDREAVLARLRAERANIEERYGLRLIGLVGSVARNEATATSDIDVFVDIIGAPTLFTIAGAEHDLEKAVGLGLRVEFVFREDLRPSLRSRMERDLVEL